MPLHDHFHRPLRGIAPWTTLHGAWATCLMGQLNRGGLPHGYIARQQVHLGTTLQIDVAAIEEEEPPVANGDPASGGTATAIWAPAKPSLIVRTNLADLDVLEVRVLLEEDMDLVGAIELVSPGNKDRQENRAVFVSKVAGYLQEKVGVIVVDVVTDRQASLHAELLELLSAPEDVTVAFTPGLYAVAYRATGKGKRSRVEMWTSGLALGEPLPVLPLWIASGWSVPVDLEKAYTAACEMAGMR